MTVAMDTKGEAANSTATALAGAAAVFWVHGYVCARVCRCLDALVYECLGVGVHGQAPHQGSSISAHSQA